jgi:hypothetical protein
MKADEKSKVKSQGLKVGGVGILRQAQDERETRAEIPPLLEGRVIMTLIGAQILRYAQNDKGGVIARSPSVM